MPAPTWSNRCVHPASPCSESATAAPCAATQTWFWILALLVVLAFSGGKR